MKCEVKGLKMEFEIGSIKVSGVAVVKDLNFNYNLDGFDFACDKGEIKDFIKTLMKATTEAVSEVVSEQCECKQYKEECINKDCESGDNNDDTEQITDVGK